MKQKKSEDQDQVAQARARRLTEVLDALAARGMTQRQVAMEINVPPQYLSDVKQGHRTLTEPFARRFAELYGLSVVWLLEGQGPKELKSLASTRINEGTVILPVLPAPCMGDPQASGLWDGSTVAIAGAAAVAAQHAEQPFLVRFSGTDATGRLQPNDLVLCSHTPREDATVVVVRTQGRVILARRASADRFQDFGSRKPIADGEVVGWAIGIVWAPL